MDSKVTNWKKVVSSISAIAIVIILIALVLSLEEGQSDEPCNRLDPCCYGEDPDFLLHLANPPEWKYWEKIDRNREGNITLFELWHYLGDNDTSLFFDNTTSYTRTALSLETLHYYVTVQDKNLVSKEGVCWLDRMVEYLD